MRCFIVSPGWAQQIAESPEHASLRFEKDSAGKMEISNLLDQVVEFKITGNDPWIYSKSPSQPISALTNLLSFEYFATRGLDFLKEERESPRMKSKKLFVFCSCT